MAYLCSALGILSLALRGSQELAGFVLSCSEETLALLVSFMCLVLSGV